MHPILFRFDFLNYNLHTYGPLLALGFIAALFWGRYAAKKAGFDPIHVSDLLVWAILGGILGARSLYVLIHLEEFSNPLDIFAVWKGGLVYYGGFLGGATGGIFYCRRHKLNILSFADIIMPALMLGQAIGRWGCLMAGCCYGKVISPDSPLGIAFPIKEDSLIPPQFQNPDMGNPTNFLHPAQIYMSLNALVIWLILWAFLSKRKSYGQVTGLFLIFYGITRSILELVRGDFGERVYYAALSTSQWVSVPVLLFGVYLVVTARKRPLEKVIETESKK